CNNIRSTLLNQLVHVFVRGTTEVVVSEVRCPHHTTEVALIQTICIEIVVRCKTLQEAWCEQDKTNQGQGDQNQLLSALTSTTRQVDIATHRAAGSTSRSSRTSLI